MLKEMLKGLTKQLPSSNLILKLEHVKISKCSRSSSDFYHVQHKNYYYLLDYVNLATAARV